MYVGIVDNCVTHRTTGSHNEVEGAGATIAATPSKTNKDNDELKDLIEETNDNAVSPGEDTENLAEDISIDIPKDKNEDTN